MMKLNRKMYLDRVSACWIGKNIGGTIGAPYEGDPNMQDISGFATPPGEPMPNDDLDLQIIWLTAVEDRGIYSITPRVLGEYWLNYVVPYCNEYGNAKANMKLGLLPPYCGEYLNEQWKNSNGAWIRTEIWACLFPGFPQYAVKYAYMDACVDHGLGEGTYAAMFTAALESAAFFENDIRKLIDVGLSYIPENCRVAKSVKLAIELYDKGTDFKDARNTIVKESEDLGLFQAPANLSFVILGLLYGEGDYKKSMIYAVNCGDDTDCTAATIGSIMGLMHGTEFVPKDWQEYIGDKIVSSYIDCAYPRREYTCSRLTERIYQLVPSVLKAHEIYMEYTDGETERVEAPELFITDHEMAETGLSIHFPDLIWAKGRVEFDKHTVRPGDEIKLDFIFSNTLNDTKQIRVKLHLPESWTADREEVNLYVREMRYRSKDKQTAIVTAGEIVKGMNKINIEISSPGRLTSTVVPLIIWG